MGTTKVGALEEGDAGLVVGVAVAEDRIGGERGRARLGRRAGAGAAVQVPPS